MNKELKAQLDALVEKFNTPAFIDNDPVKFPPDVYRHPRHRNCRVPFINHRMGQPKADFEGMPQDVVRHHARQTV